MLDRNLKAKAKMMKASTTFTEFIQPPDLGIFLSQPGKIASKVKGIPKPKAKPNIPTVGSATLPPTALTSKAPTIGPVQENETITRVRAMKNDARKPPLSTCLSALLANPEGRTISKSPKKEAANVRKSRKNNELGSQWVPRVVVKSAPALVSETMMPTLVYRMMIDKPNIRALITPLNRLGDSCMKKETVIGIIGKTQGVNIPANPKTTDNRKNPIRDRPSVRSSVPIVASPALSGASSPEPAVATSESAACSSSRCTWPARPDSPACC